MAFSDRIPRSTAELSRMATGAVTVADYMAELAKYPKDWRVIVSTPAGGGIAIEHRDVKGEPVVAIFGSNGGRFGENPLTEEEYKEKSADFLHKLENGWLYTTTHGDHRLFLSQGMVNDSCYGTHFDERIIDRMVREGLLEYYKQPYSRVGVRPTSKWGSLKTAKP